MNCSDLMNGDSFWDLMKQSPYIFQCLNQKLNYSENYKQLIIRKFSTEHMPHMIWFIIYISLLIFGAIGNLLVILIVSMNRNVRQSPRNLLILNLAISDLILCIVTQPLNFFRHIPSQNEASLVNRIDVLCRISVLFQGANVFVSSFSIIAIALDGYNVIMYAKLHGVRLRAICKICLVIWILALLLASPLTYFTHLANQPSVNINLNDKIEMINKTVCSEKQADIINQMIRLVYTIMCMIIQYLLPLAVVIFANVRIAIKIRQRTKHMERLKARYQAPIKKNVTPNSSWHENGNNLNSGDNIDCCYHGKNLPVSLKLSRGVKVSCIENLKNLTIQNESQYRKSPRRAIILLANIVIVFAMSWLPLNLSNLILELRDIWMHGQQLPVQGYNHSVSEDAGQINSQLIFTIHSACLIIVLASACLNPILYGWLNENFREGFRKLFRTIKFQERVFVMVSEM